MKMFFYNVGVVVCVLGGGILGIAIACFFGWLALCAWALFSNQFREVCKAESMIFEYRKYRKEFLAWIESKDGDGDD